MNNIDKPVDELGREMPGIKRPLLFHVAESG